MLRARVRRREGRLIAVPPATRARSICLRSSSGAHIDLEGSAYQPAGAAAEDAAEEGSVLAVVSDAADCMPQPTPPSWAGCSAAGAAACSCGAPEACRER